MTQGVLAPAAFLGVGMESISAKLTKMVFEPSRFAATLYFYTPRMRFHAVAVFAVLLSIARADPGIATHFDPRFPLAGKAVLKPLTPRKRRAPPSRYYLFSFVSHFVSRSTCGVARLHTVTHC